MSPLHRAVALVLAATVALSPAVAVAAPLAGKVKPPSSGAYVGVYRSGLPWNTSGLNAYAAESSAKPLSIVMWYQAWGPRTSVSTTPDKFLTAGVQRVLATGAVPLITWEPWEVSGDPKYRSNLARQPRYQLADINAGKYDAYIRSWARAIKAMGGPVMLRPMHEMNGTWYPWGGTVNGNSPAQFKRAWRRIHGIFRREGATNVTWVWSPNAFSVPQTYSNRISAYYPGNDYVDWIGLSGFNWGTSRRGGKWRSFTEVYDDALRELSRFRKPIVIAEIGSVERGGNKAAWIKNAYARIRWRYTQVKAVVYFDMREQRGSDVMTWQLASSSRSARAYRSAVAHRHFRAGPVGSLAAWQALSAP